MVIDEENRLGFAEVKAACLSASVSECYVDNPSYTLYYSPTEHEEGVALSRRYHLDDEVPVLSQQRLRQTFTCFPTVN
jgi:hypothetical protein